MPKASLTPDPILRKDPDLQDELKGKFGGIGKGGFDDFSVDPFRLPGELGGVGVTVGDFEMYMGI
ncbi:MAG: hypothetical protein OXD43_15995 [Bacteroidetes bacterium]|nr:hypothetical protein [Bacteroidota bacterium]